MGKSTLFNRLVGQRQAIVDETAGTTRDRHYGKTDWNGKEFSVIDTGGYTVNSEDIFEDENVRKVFTVILPTDVIGDYTLTVKLGDEIIEEREIFAGTISADFEVSGTGKKEYAIWIGENPYTVVPVDFGTNG